ncbi:MAG: DinB family protein [Melioribacteraceae bacterium]|nr:DinB family protein [Melioribacteraceae bacterium]MCF8392801.1 DinB family protein [Melioribacteraceae bacterium]MCF8418713.1 DinB family protein [Melioribacteraceae bacterium]
MEPPKDQDKILEIYRQGPKILESALVDLSNIDLDYVPSNGGWSIRQIIHHVVDGDDLWKIGIKMALGGEQAEFILKWYISLPQIEWAKRWGYEKRAIDVSLTLFRAIREHIFQLLKFAPEGWSKSVLFRNSNGEIEVVPVGFIIQMQSNHVEHHVKRILEIREEISGT